MRRILQYRRRKKTNTVTIVAVSSYITCIDSVAVHIIKEKRKVELFQESIRSTCTADITKFAKLRQAWFQHNRIEHTV